MEKDEEIFRITKDNRRADALIEMAKDRYKNINFKEPYRTLEEYYEIIKELLTAFMYKQGFKTLSHKALIEFAAENIKILSTAELSLIDELRIKRNNIAYYGEKVTLEFLKSRENSVKEIINKLFKL
jgi:hypothetical protein